MATEVAQLIYKVDTSQVKSAGKEVDRLGTTTQKTQRNTSDFGRRAGMAGIQVEQLSNQIAGGQNVMRAFGAQAADLGFVLGTPLLGAVIGVGAAFLSMIPTMADASEESDKLTDDVMNLSRGLHELTEAQRASISIKFAEKIAEIEMQSRGLTSQIELQQEEVDDLNEKYERGQFQLGKWLVTQEEFEAQLKKEKDQLSQLNGALDGNNQTVNRLNGILDGSISKSAEYVDALREEMIVLGMTSRQKAIYRALSEGANQAQITEINLIYDAIEAKNAEIEAIERENAARIKREKAGERQAAADAAASKRQAAADAAAAKRAADAFNRRSESASQYADRLSLLRLDEQARETEMHNRQLAELQTHLDQKLITEQEYNDAVNGLTADRERKNRESLQRQAEDEARLRYQNMDMLDRYIEHFDQNMITFRDIGAATMMTFEQSVGNAFEQFATGQATAEEALQMVTRSILTGVINALGQMVAQYIISQLAIDSFARTAAVAAATGTSFQSQAMVMQAGLNAYASTAAIPVVGPALAPAAMATAIAATQPLATAAGTLAMTGAVIGGRALGGQVRPGESYVVGERGPEVLTMGNIMGKITTNEALRGNTGNTSNTSNVANVSFNINANDTRGFDRLLQQRRGQIVNMINDALNENGKVAIV